MTAAAAVSTSSSSWNRFKTLLLREWMQHKRGWIVTLLTPPVIVLAILPFGHVDGGHSVEPLALGAIAVMATALALLVISGVSTALQLSGLARRDVQDRSIEFWLSLPGSHSESIGAMVLAHLLLVPLVILLCGYVLGFVLAAGFALRIGGFGMLTDVPWGRVVETTFPLLARMALGLPVALLWLAPLVMLVMNASAWLKRWGIPTLVAAAIVTCAIVPAVYGVDIFRRVLREQLDNAGMALFGTGEGLDGIFHAVGRGDSSGVLPWVLQDGLHALQAVPSAQFVGGLLVAAAGFALLILRRRRGGA